MDEETLLTRTTLQLEAALRGRTEVLSLLDAVLMPLRGRGEKTYSAPLATRSFAKEMVELPGGTVALVTDAGIAPQT